MEGNGTPPEKPADQAEPTVTDEQLPHPDSDPVDAGTPEAEQEQHVDVPCAGCGQVYGFDIKPNTATFTFVCRKCNTRSEWVRAD